MAEGPIYAPRTLPGERVSGVLEADTLTDIKILTPSDHRVKAPCPHFKACGGCLVQHAADPLVATWKQDIVRSALAYNQIETEIRPILTSPQHSRRRAKYAARRTKSGAIAGFRGRASHDIVDVRDCTVTSAALAHGPDLARVLATLGGSRKSELAVQITEISDGLDVAVEQGKPLDDGLQQELPRLLPQFGIARLTWNGGLVAQSAAPRHRIGEADVRLPPGAFLQATQHGEAALQASVAEAIGAVSSAVDLFAGCGTFALYLASRCRVHAVEGDRGMTDALQTASNTSDLTFPVSTEVRDLFDTPLLDTELARFEAVILDPPRAGAVAQVAQIAMSRVPIVAYVSCDPGSFARDASILCRAGYRLDWVQPVDQFRWSPHVELAARFTL